MHLRLSVSVPRVKSLTSDSAWECPPLKIAEWGHPGTVLIQKHNQHPSRRSRGHPGPWPNSPDKERARLGHIGVGAQPRQGRASQDQLGPPIQGGQT